MLQGRPSKALKDSQGFKGRSGGFQINFRRYWCGWGLPKVSKKILGFSEGALGEGFHGNANTSKNASGRFQKLLFYAFQ